MLTDLLVEGLGLIDRVEVSFDRGSVALTGETGAGKTLIVSALGLLLGDRADRSLLRSGTDRAVVEARFEVSDTHAASVAAAAAIGEDCDGEIVLARRIGGDGKSRARINGRIVPASVLRDVGSALVEIAGQNQHQRLASRSFQRQVLDSFSGERALELVELLKEAVRAARAAAEALANLERSAADRERRRDSLRFEIAEIEAAAVEEGERARLEQEITKADNAASIAGAVEAALQAVGSDDGAAALAARASEALVPVAELLPDLAALADRLRGASLELDDIGHSLAGSVAPAGEDSLDELRARLEILRRLERKYGTSDGGISGYLARAQAELLELEDDGPTAARLGEEARALKARAEELASELGSLRRETAPALEAALQDLLGRLAMQGARCEVRLEPCELGPHGSETVELALSANAGEEPKPVARVASGGELARFALALHLITATDDTPTMIFDEVDAGVGGAAAHSVGRALADLARKRTKQVMVVTHLPQVAAFADQHLRVRKEESGGRTSAIVERVEDEERVAELSRMLAGFPDSASARDHARELLAIGARP